MGYEHKQDRRIYTDGFVAGHQPYIITEDVLQELQRARRKFPDQNIWVTLAALTEEVGELNQAVLQLNYELQQDASAAEEHIYAEAVQVAVMAIRVALDCDYRPAA